MRSARGATIAASSTGTASRTDRGAIAIVVGVGVVLMLGLVAVAVDLGNGWAERRHVQNAADMAALAGAVELATGADGQEAIDAMLDSVDDNYGTISTGEWLSPNCTDGDALLNTAAALGLTPATDCISFAADFSEVRIRIPTQELDTAFAPAIGIDQLRVGASANAYGSFAHGTPLPFAVLDGYQAGDQACLRTSSNLTPGPVWTGNGPNNAPGPGPGTDPCDSAAMAASSQYMGTLNPSVWFDDLGNVICKSNEVAYLIAAGLDHEMARFKDTPDPSTSPGYGQGSYGIPDSREVEDHCAPTPTDKPNTIQLTTGVTSSMLRCGLVTARSGNCATDVPGPAGVSAKPARLHQGDYVQSTYKVLGEDFDNEPLWNFIRPDIAYVAAPNACKNVYANRNNATWDYYDKLDEMIKCLDKWQDAAYGFIFTEEIVNTSRFLFTPLLAEDTLDNTDSDGPKSCPTTASAKCVHVDDWVPIYIMTLYIESGGLSANCDPNGVGVGRHYAGQQFSCGPTNKNIDGASAMVLACGQMPPRICNPRGGGNPHYPGGDPIPLIGVTR